MKYSVKPKDENRYGWYLVKKERYDGVIEMETYYDIEPWTATGWIGFNNIVEVVQYLNDMQYSEMKKLVSKYNGKI